MNLQERLNALIAEKGVSQATLADRAGIDRADVSRLLRGSEPRYTVRTILKIARGLGVSPRELVAGVDELPTKLADDLGFWVEHLAEGEAARAERDDLRSLLASTLQDMNAKVADLEAEHADEVRVLRGHAARARAERDAARDELRAVKAQLRSLNVETAALRIQVANGDQRDRTRAAEIARLREALVTAEQGKVSAGLLGALFGAGASALLRTPPTGNDTDEE